MNEGMNGVELTRSYAKHSTMMGNIYTYIYTYIHIKHNNIDG